ncbi:hypothetical protein PFAG_00817 [Plasmodium falciparum Santa Lucia]|uniref:Plasmodium RESA N-terminal domain-containing protein n=1 Tax=Plasmodium falciparum Santa Lucia TaxID=478859 RepID=W7GBG1_PLAFA|nr:hypothetical protein PFAG_00817 [Plasmodium falciparum Santa Lucia]
MYSNCLRHRPHLSLCVFLLVCIFYPTAYHKSSSGSCVNSLWSRNLSEPNNSRNSNLYNNKLKSNPYDSKFRNDIYTSRGSHNTKESKEKSSLRDGVSRNNASDVSRNHLREPLYKRFEKRNNDPEEQNKLEEERKKGEEEQNKLEEERKKREEEKSNDTFLSNNDTNSNGSTNIDSSELLENDIDEYSDSNDISILEDFNNDINEALNLLSDDEIDDMINNLNDIASFEEMHNIWNELCKSEKYKFLYLIYDLRKLYEELIDDIDDIEEEEEELWETCVFGVGKIQVRASGTYNDLFNNLLSDEYVSKKEFIDFIKECRNRLSLIRSQLKDKCEKKIIDALSN